MKSYTFLLLLIFFCLTHHLSYSQNGFSTSIILAESNNVGLQVAEFDNHYYIFSSGLCFNDDTWNCFFVSKVDLNGEEVWNKKFQDTETKVYASSFYGLTFLKDSTLLVTAGSFGENGEDFPILMNLTLEGDTLWTKTIEEPLNNVLWDSKLLPSGNIFSMGWEANEPGTGQDQHLVLRKLSPLGDLLWKNEMLTDCSIDIPGHLTWVDNSHFLVAHYCRVGSLDYYPMVSKIDTSGNLLWTDYYEDSATSYQLARRGLVQPLPNGGYVFPWSISPGESFPPRPKLFAIDEDHNLNWELILPQIMNDIDTEVDFINTTSNGDLVWIGTLPGHMGYEHVPCIGRISPEGELLWVRYYYFTDRPWDNSESFIHIIETSDGGFLASGIRLDLIEGTSDDYESNPWLLKVDANGCLIPGCTDPTVYLQSDTAFVNTNQAFQNTEPLFRLSPNPAGIFTKAYFFSSASTQNKTLHLFSINGQLMQTQHLDGSQQTVQIDLGNLPKGVYVMTLEADGQVLQRERLIRE